MQINAIYNSKIICCFFKQAQSTGARTMGTNEIPNHRGPPGSPGNKGDKGDSIVGPRGPVGYPGYPGRKGGKNKTVLPAMSPEYEIGGFIRGPAHPPLYLQHHHNLVVQENKTIRSETL